MYFTIAHNTNHLALCILSIVNCATARTRGGNYDCWRFVKQLNITQDKSHFTPTRLEMWKMWDERYAEKAESWYEQLCSEIYIISNWTVNRALTQAPYLALIQARLKSTFSPQESQTVSSFHVIWGIFACSKLFWSICTSRLFWLIFSSSILVVLLLDLDALLCWAAFGLNCWSTAVF